LNAIARICAVLDGLPLAIELAAARTKLLSPQALLLRLTRPLELLTGGGLDVPQRHQTLRATLEWSYGLLHPAEQQFFRRLAVFEHGCALAAAEAVCAISGTHGVTFLDLVTSLINKSLLQSEEHDAGEPRLHMLNTVRAFSLECLQASGELELLEQARAAYDCAVTQDESRLQDGSQECRPGGLTSRELEVLQLVATGCSNAAIAERLVVSNATVRAHLVSVYRKLGVGSRTEAMRFAIDHQLA
jgi:predicted ATPase